MRSFDHDYIAHLMTRLGQIQADTRPAWGRMNRSQMVRHLADTVRYSMGNGHLLPDKSTWISRKILGPLVMHGLVRIPKNIQGDPLPRLDLGDILEINPDQYLLYTLQGYLDAVQADEFTPHPHPAFGTISVDAWAKVHVAHFEHHLRQFSA